MSVLDGARLAARFRELEVEFADTRRPGVRRCHGAAPPRRPARASPTRSPRSSARSGPGRSMHLTSRRRSRSTSRRPRSRCSAPRSHGRRRVCSRTTPVSGSASTRKPCIRRGSRPAGSAPIFVRSAPSSTPSGTHHCAPSCSGSARVLGVVRDTDVLHGAARGADRDAPEPEDHEPGKHLVDGLRDQREHARAELLAAMRSDRYLDLLDRLRRRRACGRRRRTAAADLDLELGALVAGPWQKLRRAVRRSATNRPTSRLHAVRIRAKRCRYAAEAVCTGDRQARQALRGRNRRRPGRARRSPGCGRRRGMAAAHATLGGSDPVERAFVAGELAALEDVAAEESRAAWPDVWKRARRRSLPRVDVSGAPTVRAAGGIVHRGASDGEPLVLLVHRPRYDDWSLPKGKADPGERAEETALARGRGGDRPTLPPRRPRRRDPLPRFQRAKQDRAATG